jgi:hypothetical protein
VSSAGIVSTMDPLGGRQGLRGALARHWPLVVTLVVGMGYMAIVTILHSQAVSPIDEPQYLDYIDKLYQQGIVRRGEFLGELVRTLFACHGVVGFGTMGPMCGTDLSDPSQFPYQGLSSAPIYTPVQFWITRVIGDVFGLVPGIGQINGWRLVGTLWLGVGIVFTYLTARKLRVADVRFVAVALAIVASPFGYWSFSFVSTDGPIFAYGAVALWLAVRFARGEGSGWWLVLVGAIGPLFKATSLVAIGFVAIYLIVRRIRDARRLQLGLRGAVLGAGSSRIWIAAVALAANVLVQVAWTRIQPLLAINDTSVDQGVATPPTFDLFGQQITAFLNGALQWVVPQTDAISIFLPLQWLAVAGVVGAVLLLPRASGDRALSISVLVGYLVAAPVLALSIVLATGSFFPVPPRYGIALVPGLILVTAGLLRWRWAIRALIAYDVLLLVYQLAVTMVFARWFP